MKHFSFTDWADFANGLSPHEQIVAMRRHLDEDCEKCKKLLATCRNIKTSAKRIVEYEPPTRALQAAKSAFVLYGPRKQRSRISEMAELVFDSIDQALPAGVRSMAMETESRKLLYRRGTIQIDLNVNPTSSAQTLHIDGQVLDSAATGNILPGIAVFLMSGKNRLAQGHTNPLGEFHLECPASENLRLCVWISADREVILPLDQHVRTVSREHNSKNL